VQIVPASLAPLAIVLGDYRIKRMNIIDLPDWGSFEPQLTRLCKELVEKRLTNAARNYFFEDLETRSGSSAPHWNERGCEEMSLKEYYLRANTAGCRDLHRCKVEVEDFSVELGNTFSINRER
jgi:hypothetical protein